MACCADAGRDGYKQHKVRYHPSLLRCRIKAWCETLAPGKHRPLEDPDLTNGSGPGQTRHDAKPFAVEAISRRSSPSSTVLAVRLRSLLLVSMHVKGAE